MPWKVGWASERWQNEKHYTEGERSVNRLCGSVTNADVAEKAGEILGEDGMDGLLNGSLKEKESGQ